jgi:hypothetical protein
VGHVNGNLIPADYLSSKYLAAMRYYEPKYPEVDELVMVQVRQIAEMGAYVKLVCVEMSMTQSNLT